MSGGFPVRCFTCGKIMGNKYDVYVEMCKTQSSSTVLDQLKLGRPCCRRMLATHVDIEKYQLLYPTHPDGVERLNADDIVETVDAEKPRSISILDDEDEDIY